MHAPSLPAFVAAAALLTSVPARAVVYTQGEPTNDEQLLLELVNRARANPQAEADRLGIGLNDGITGETIENTPKQPLAFNAQIIDAARKHSDWMLAADVFSHTGDGGSSPGDRMKAAGYKFTGNWTWGENIAWNGTTGTPNLTQFTREAHDGLIRSPGHRINIMNGDFDDVGLGVRPGQFFSDGRNWNAVMTTEGFARSDFTPGPVFVGVVYQDQNHNDFYDPGEGVANVTVTVAGGKDSAVTSNSGGYFLPYTGSGAIAVTFKHATFGTKTLNATRTGQNIKLDWLATVQAVPSTLELSISRPSTGFIQLQIGGTYKGNIQIDRSADLTSWELAGIIPKNADTASYLDATTSRSRAFYRILSNP